MAEILPSTAAGYDSTTQEIEMPNDGISREVTETGPKNIIDARRDFYRGLATMGSSGIACLSYSESSGRASLTVSYNRTASLFESIGTDDEIQELSAFDIIRDIKSAYYFSPLTNDQVIAVDKAFQNRWTQAEIPGYASWNDGQKSLLSHMAHGQESYIDTAYEFRRTFTTNSNKLLAISADNPNTVTTLPELTPTLKRLISTMPTGGEWLKKPTTLTYAGRRGWIVTETYQWAKAWSVIYGGSFTGL